MSQYKQLVDDICQENDYLLTFQTQPQTQHLVRCLISLRDGKTTSLQDLTDALQNELTLIDISINKIDSENEERKWEIDYLNEIRYGIQSSYDKVITHEKKNK